MVELVDDDHVKRCWIDLAEVRLVERLDHRKDVMSGRYAPSAMNLPERAVMEYGPVSLKRLPKNLLAVRNE
jgi:hypothetical protein